MEFVERRKTREVPVGDLVIGGDNPIWVQSMTITDTRDVDATVAQIHQLEEAGCEIVRVAVINNDAVKALGPIKQRINIPLVADIHFRFNLALGAIDQGVDKIRLNPGNIGGDEPFNEVIRKCKDVGMPVRIGVNSGSVEQDLLDKYGYPKPEAIVESALRHVEMCEKLGFENLVISLKSTDTLTAVRSARMFSAQCDYPLHLGITEAGMIPYGITKSAAGLGAMLLDGIGDTIRVSLTGDPVPEIAAAFDILKATGRRAISPELIACPSCGRIDLDLDTITREVADKTSHLKVPIKIAILGCAVNGPGEAREADLGVAGGRGTGMVFRKGEEIRRCKEEELVDVLMEEVEKLVAEIEAAEVTA
jgi:(E)-4-hydroxy-3-methylbut-2-enyl-diphosphate synthase